MDSKQFRISEMVMDGAFALNFNFSIDEMAKHLKPKLKLPLLKCKTIAEQAIRRGVEDKLYVVNEDRLCVGLPLDWSFTDINDKNISGKNRHKILPSRQRGNGLISTKIKRRLCRPGDIVGVRKSSYSQEKQQKIRRVRVGQERLKKRKNGNNSTCLKSIMKGCSLPAKQIKENVHSMNKLQSSMSSNSKIKIKSDISGDTLTSQASSKSESFLDEPMIRLNTNTPMEYDEELSNQYGPIHRQEWEQNVIV